MKLRNMLPWPMHGAMSAPTSAILPQTKARGRATDDSVWRKTSDYSATAPAKLRARC